MSANLHDLFESFNDEFLKFERVEQPKHNRPDLCAFLMLSELVSGENNRDFIDSAAHDEIWLDVDIEEFEKVATPEIIKDLVRCGIRHDSENDSLCMFV